MRVAVHPPASAATSAKCSVGVMFVNANICGYGKSPALLHMPVIHKRTHSGGGGAGGRGEGGGVGGERRWRRQQRRWCRRSSCSQSVARPRPPTTTSLHRPDWVTSAPPHCSHRRHHQHYHGSHHQKNNNTRWLSYTYYFGTRTHNRTRKAVKTKENKKQTGKERWNKRGIDYKIRDDTK